MRRCGRSITWAALALSLVSCGGDPALERNPFGNPTPQQPSAGMGAGGSGTPGGGLGNVGNPTGQAPNLPSGGQSMAGTGSGSSDQECASARVHTSISTPIILFVVDGSGSMCDAFGGSTRWQALRTALLDPTNGLVYKLQSDVVFGTMIYDGTIDLTVGIGGGGSPSPQCAGMYTAMKMAGECPQLIQVAPALDNAAALDAAFPATELGGSTPTHKAMKAAVDLMATMVSTDPDMPGNPLYIILATDGAPNDICVGGQGGDSSVHQASVIAEVDRAASLGIKTFVISLAGNDATLQSHLEMVADHGQPMNPDAKAFSPMVPEELVDTLSLLIGGAIGCEVQLSGTVTVGRECLGSVAMNGVKLPCCREMGGSWMCNNTAVDEASGWRLKDERTVELVGAECVSFLTATEASLEARFPCDVFSPD